MQAVALVVLFGFFVLGLLAYRTYTEQPPIPERVVDPAGETIFTRDDVMAGQEVFLRNGLMEYGSIFGHGAYLGPDYTADYLHRGAPCATLRRRRLGSARTRTIEDFQTNRYDEETDTLEYTAAQADAFERAAPDYGSSSPTRRPSSGCARGRSTTPTRSTS